MTRKARCEVRGSARSQRELGLAIVGAAVTMMSIPGVATGQVRRDRGERFACPHSALDTVSYSSSGLSHLRLVAGPGKLSIKGTGGGSQIRILSRRCGSEARLLEHLSFDVQREADGMVVTVQIPTQMFSPTVGTLASIDFAIEVPPSMRLTITDGSGDVELENIGAVTLEDALGNVRITSVDGDIEGRTGPGDVTINGVLGHVSLTAAVGDVRIERVGGDVTIGPHRVGTTRVQHVEGRVTVGDEHVGQVLVDDVGGDLVLEGFRQGDARYRNVRGRVLRGQTTIPQR